ncbi:MAG TPA: YafY family protein [Beutenbergiaceae bacterium]|nr:YafY family protein [Beutenbergiaceae bacterium]
MPSTAERALDILGVLQTPGGSTGAELADRLQVTTRTIRQDIARLRALGYRIESGPGPGGGYRLTSGPRMPPLLLSDDEVVALVLSLRAGASSIPGTATGTVPGPTGDAVQQVLAKLHQVLPAKLAPQVDTLLQSTKDASPSAYAVDPARLTAIAVACRRREGLRFTYCSADGAITQRRADPQRLVFNNGRWYLIAFDTDRGDWRTYRVDRMQLQTPGGPRFVARADPDGDAAQYLTARLHALGHQYHAVVRIDAPAISVASWMRPEWGEVEAVDEHSCLLRTTGDSYEMLAVGLALIGEPFEVLEPPELIGYLQAAGRRLLAAARASDAGSPGSRTE